MLLDKLEIPYTSKPGKGIIFFKWHDTNQLPKEIIEDKYYEYAYELVDLHRPFHICNKAEYDLICVLFSLNSRSPTFEIRPTDRLFLM
ncbi:MAG: hypothetical protein CMB80_31120 [Flammeovirgaceae bacterium]|nr:hypothetical protein [Flammeovirgaceae bacterium]